MIVEGNCEVVVLVAPDFRVVEMVALRASLAAEVPIASAFRVIRSCDMARDEAVFRLGGLTALKPLLEDQQ